MTLPPRPATREIGGGDIDEDEEAEDRLSCFNFRSSGLVERFSGSEQSVTDCGEGIPIFKKREKMYLVKLLQKLKKRKESLSSLKTNP